MFTAVPLTHTRCTIHVCQMTDLLRNLAVSLHTLGSFPPGEGRRVQVDSDSSPCSLKEVCK